MGFLIVPFVNEQKREQIHFSQFIEMMWNALCNIRSAWWASFSYIYLFIILFYKRWNWKTFFFDETSINAMMEWQKLSCSFFKQPLTSLPKLFRRKIEKEKFRQITFSFSLYLITQINFHNISLLRLKRNPFYPFSIYPPSILIWFGLWKRQTTTLQHQLFFFLLFSLFPHAFRNDLSVFK